jgi:hypothetical protein
VQGLTILLAAVISSTEQGGQVRLLLKLVSETEMQVDVSSTNAKRLIEEGTALMAVRTVLHAHGGRFSMSAVGTSEMTYELTLPLLVGTAAKERFNVESAHH